MQFTACHGRHHIGDDFVAYSLNLLNNINVILGGIYHNIANLVSALLAHLACHE